MKRTANEQIIIELFKQYREIRMTQVEVQFALYKIYELNIPTREIRKCISNINCDRETKFFILTDGKHGYYTPKRMTAKLAQEESNKLRKRALSELYRSSSMLKKFNMPFEDIFGAEIESFGDE